MTSPYAARPPRSFWRTGVADVDGMVLPELYRAKFPIDRSMPIATAGSCFAQHIGRAMRTRGFNVLDAEPAPPGLDDAAAQAFGYRIYSARYANIYTVRQFVQIVEEALGRFTPAEQVWEKAGRFYDAMRPSVEPEGLSSPELVLQHRAHHLAAVRQVLAEASVLVFTMGLTEAWVDRETGCVYPTAPGTIAGQFDPDRHVFKNFDYPEILEDFTRLRALLKEINPGLRMLVTVSPVPLTATAGDEHVLAATTYSKSVLRAVAGKVAREYDDVDYFPSYEVITSAKARGRFFSDNLRSVEPIGVATVMATFFGEEDPANAVPEVAAPGRQNRPGARKVKPMGGNPVDPERAAARAERIAMRQARQEARRTAAAQGKRPQGKGQKGKAASKDDVVCEEALLEAFAR